MTSRNTLPPIAIFEDPGDDVSENHQGMAKLAEQQDHGDHDEADDSSEGGFEQHGLSDDDSGRDEHSDVSVGEEEESVDGSIHERQDSFYRGASTSSQETEEAHDWPARGSPAPPKVRHMQDPSGAVTTIYDDGLVTCSTPSLHSLAYYARHGSAEHSETRRESIASDQDHFDPDQHSSSDLSCLTAPRNIPGRFSESETIAPPLSWNDPGSRKASDAVSTLPEEFDYYFRPHFPGRYPLSFSRSLNSSRPRTPVSDKRAAPQDHEIRKSSLVLNPSGSYHHCGSPTKVSPPQHHAQRITPSGRPVFRNPSSVLEMQLRSPSPPGFSSSPLSGKRSPWRQHERHRTNESFASRSQAGTPSSNLTPSRRHPNPKKEYPLVLLHCTLSSSPFPLSYPRHIVDDACPESVRTAIATLAQKLTPTVLERGVLIPHPGEDYELLEERVLECLELKKPRVGACGHFSNDNSPGDAEQRQDSNGACEDDRPKCVDCQRHVNPQLLPEDERSQHRTWDVRVYAANGLMRAGAWNACWREMEKVDVEVSVWVSSEVRKAIEEGTRKLEQELEQRGFPPSVAMEKTRSTSGHKPQMGEKPTSTAACSRPTSSRSEKERPAKEGSKHERRQKVDGSSRRLTEGPLPLSTLMFNWMQHLWTQYQTAFLTLAIGLLILSLVAKLSWFTSSGNHNFLPAASPSSEDMDNMEASSSISFVPSATAKPEQISSVSQCNYGQDDMIDRLLKDLKLDACELPLEPGVTAVPKLEARKVLTEVAERNLPANLQRGEVSPSQRFAMKGGDIKVVEVLGT